MTTNLNQSFQAILDAKTDYEPFSIFKQSTRKTPHYQLMVQGDNGEFYDLPYIQLWGRKYEEKLDRVSGKWLITTKLESANLVLELNFINFAAKLEDFRSELSSFNIESINHCSVPLQNIDFAAVKVHELYVRNVHFAGEGKSAELEEVA